MTPPPEPRTVRGRALLKVIEDYSGSNLARRYDIAAIEAEAAGAPLREAIMALSVIRDEGGVLVRRASVLAALTATPAPAPLDVLDVDALAEALLAWFPKQAIGSDTDVRMAADHITAEYARLTARAAATENTDAQ